MKKLNAYHVRLKLTAQKDGYKPKYVKGIVYSRNEKFASAAALNAISKNAEELDNPPFDIEVKSIDKLRAEFVITAKEITYAEPSQT